MLFRSLVVAGRDAESGLVEIVELKDHPFMVGAQFHPEFTSRPNHPNPLFRDFIGAACERAAQRLASAQAAPSSAV